MQLKIHKGRVDLSGTPILSNVEIEINTKIKHRTRPNNEAISTTVPSSLFAHILLCKKFLSIRFY